MGFDNWSLEKRFSVLSLLTLIFIGTVILLGNLWFTRSQLVLAAARFSEAWVNSAIRHQFTQEDFQKPMDKSRYEALNRYFSTNVLNDEIKRIKVWDKEGKIVYSDEASILGKKFPMAEDLLEALRGHTSAEFTELDEAEQETEQELGRRLLEVYVPIYSDNGEVLGAFELYIHDKTIKGQLAYNYRVIIAAVVISLGALYFSLMGIVRRASRTISTQSNRISKLSNNLLQSLKWQERTQLGMIKALMSALNAKDNYTAGHCNRVSEYSVKIGRKMGLPDDQLKLLEEAALFHDIGKIGISEAILNKPGSFTEEEYEIMKKHPVIGAEILGSCEHFARHRQVVRYHHERVDGKGYPEGLVAGEIPLESRILAVADTYDALTSDRPYRQGMCEDKALKIIQDIRGTQLDDEVTGFFLELWRKS